MSGVILSGTKYFASRVIFNFGTDASPWAQHDKLARALSGEGVRQMCEYPIEGFTLHGSHLISVKSHATTIHTMPVYTMHLIDRISRASQLFLRPFLACSTHGVSPFISCKPFRRLCRARGGRAIVNENVFEPLSQTSPLLENQAPWTPLNPS
jgi:hypothetical protein